MLMVARCHLEAKAKLKGVKKFPTARIIKSYELSLRLFPETSNLFGERAKNYIKSRNDEHGKLFRCSFYG
jgi:hypothetical protein